MQCAVAGRGRVLPALSRYFLCEAVMRLTSDRQYLIVVPMLMAVVWMAIFALLGQEAGVKIGMVTMSNRVIS